MSRASLLVLALLSLAAWRPAPARAEEFTPAQRSEIVAVMRAAMKADPSILRDAVGALQADEAARREVAARAVIGKLSPAISRAQGDPVAGDEHGDVTLVEFYDLRCPYCRRMLPVVADLLRAEPHLRLVYKDIPVLGPPSALGARAVLAAQRQDGYLKLREAVMTGPAAITEDTLRAQTVAAGLDWPRLRHDMDDPAVAARIEQNLGLSRQLGIEGTPTYIVGGRMIQGATTMDGLREAVADARAGRG